MAWTQPTTDSSQQPKKPLIHVLLPHRDNWHAEWVEATWKPLCQPSPWCEKIFNLCRIPSLPNARNTLAKIFLEGNAEYALWIDYDHIVEKPTIKIGEDKDGKPIEVGDINLAAYHLYRALEQSGESIVTALYRAKQQHGFNYAIWNHAVTPEGKPSFVHVQNWEPPTANFFAVDVCLPTGSTIYTPDGQRLIENIKPNDVILGVFGHQTVLDCKKRNYIGDIIKIEARYLPPVYFTEEHPILIKQYNTKNIETKWIEAKNVQRTKNRKQGKLNSFVVIPKEKEEIPRDVIPVDKVLELTPKIAKLLGLWFAEGCAFATGENNKQHRYQFSYNMDEKELVDFTKDALKELGLNPFIRVVEDMHTTWVWGNSTSFTRFLRRNFGHGATEKKIPEWLFYERKNIIESFLEGLVLGDGHIGKEYDCKNIKKHYRPSTQLKLANNYAIIQIQRLFRKIGIVTSYRRSTSENEIRGKVYTSNQAALHWTPNPKKNYYKEDEDYYYFPISKITKTKYSGDVYNLTTTERQFLVPFIVHNCGMGMMLMRRRVLEAMRGAGYGTDEKPFFHWEHPDSMSEDFDFLVKAAKLGYKTWCLTDVKLSHMGDVVIESTGNVRVPRV
jgi:intein/homing endonuclease